MEENNFCDVQFCKVRVVFIQSATPIRAETAPEKRKNKMFHFVSFLFHFVSFCFIFVSFLFHLVSFGFNLVRTGPVLVLTHTQKRTCFIVCLAHNNGPDMGLHCVVLPTKVVARIQMQK